MGRTFYRLIILLAVPVAAWGQGVRVDGVASGPRGPIANPTITVCTSAGNGTPCTPLAATPAAGQPFTNQALTVAAMNPLPVLPVGAVSTNAGVDALGNYGFWVQPGTHVRISITGPGVATPVLQDVTIPCDATQGCTTSLSLTNPGVFNNTQNNFYGQSLLNSCNPGTEFGVEQGSNFTTDALTGCVIVPISSTQFNSNAVSGYTQCLSTTTFCIGGYFSGRAGATGTHVNTLNSVVDDKGFQTTGYGVDIGTNVSNSSSLIGGILIEGIITQNGAPSAIQIATPASFDGTHTYTRGVWLQDGTANSLNNFSAIEVGSQTTSASSPSMNILFYSRDAGNVRRQSGIGVSSAGTISISPFSGATLNNGNLQEAPNFGVIFSEGTSPGASASNDVCYGDSTLHALKCSYNNGTFFQMPQVITATSAAFATATTAGTCVQNTTSVTGATTSMTVSTSPVSTPGVGAVWSAFVSSAGNVTINECAVATSAGGTIAFNIRVTP